MRLLLAMALLLLCPIFCYTQQIYTFSIQNINGIAIKDAIVVNTTTGHRGKSTSEGTYVLPCWVHDTISVISKGYINERVNVTLSSYYKITLYTSAEIYTLSVTKHQVTPHDSFLYVQDIYAQGWKIKNFIPNNGQLTKVNKNDKTYSFRYRRSYDTDLKLGIKSAIYSKTINNTHLPQLQYLYGIGEKTEGNYHLPSQANFYWGDQIHGSQIDNKLIPANVIVSDNAITLIKKTLYKSSSLLKYRYMTDQDILSDAKNRNSKLTYRYQYNGSGKAKFQYHTELDYDVYENHNVFGYNNYIYKNWLLGEHTIMDEKPIKNNAIHQKGWTQFISICDQNSEWSIANNSRWIRQSLFHNKTIATLFLNEFEAYKNFYLDEGKNIFMTLASKAESIHDFNQVERDLLNASIIPSINYSKNNLKFQIGNNSFLSTKQISVSFLPFGSIRVNLYRKNRTTLLATTSYSTSIKNISQLYSDASFITLDKPTSDFNSVHQIPVIIIDNNIKNELTKKINGTLKLNSLDFKAELSHAFITIENAIFPTNEINGFVLKNIGNIAVHNTLLRLEKSIQDRRSYSLNLVGEIGRSVTRTTSTTNNKEPQRIVGFQDVYVELTPSTRVGVIKLPDYDRDQNGSLIIGADGFPILSKKYFRSIDPTPDIIGGLSLEFEYKKFSLEIGSKYQIGGQQWNGTQASLDYHGRSKISGDTRHYVNVNYQGNTTDGHINTKLVNYIGNDTKDSRWVRYGELGAASDYIIDASHFAIQKIKLGFKDKEYQHRLKVELILTNPIYLSHRGYTDQPFLQSSIGYAINYYNPAIQSTTGISLTYKL